MKTLAAFATFTLVFSASMTAVIAATPYPEEESFRRATNLMASAKTPDERKAAVEQFRIAAKAGHPEAQFKLGEAYEHALGVSADPGTALLWYVSAATNRHAGAAGKLRFGITYPGESQRSVSIVKGKRTEKSWEIKSGTVRIRDGNLCCRAEFTGKLKTYDNDGKRSMMVTSGWTRAELEQAAAAENFGVTRAAENELKVGDRWFYLENGKVVGIDYALHSKHPGH
jgi:TPR repeat protein